ncbi:MAG: acyltransferase [Candidatus Hodarchaeota archaeon]
MKIKGTVFIGPDVYIDDYTPQDIEINDGTVIQTRSILISHMRGRGKIVIGRNVFIGPNAVILKDTEIGEGAVVMAGSVVTKNVPPFTMVGGVPAVPLGKLSHHLGLSGDLKKFMLSVRPLTRT